VGVGHRPPDGLDVSLMLGHEDRRAEQRRDPHRPGGPAQQPAGLGEMDLRVVPAPQQGGELDRREVDVARGDALAAVVERLAHKAVGLLQPPQPRGPLRRLGQQEGGPVAGLPGPAGPFYSLERQLQARLDLAVLVENVAEVGVGAVQVVGGAALAIDRERLAQLGDPALAVASGGDVDAYRVERVRFDPSVAHRPGDLDRLLRERNRLVDVADQHADLGERGEHECALGAGRLRGDQLGGLDVGLERLAVVAARP
jgi:hypothetical protein